MNETVTTNEESVRDAVDPDYIAAWKAISQNDGEELETADAGAAAAVALKSCFRNAKVQFQSGNGVVIVDDGMSDKALVTALRMAMKFHNKFSVNAR